jgi:hypothetical protein
MSSPAAMDEPISSNYFSELRTTVDDLFDMELQVVPAISCSVDRDEYTGLNEFNDWRDSGCDNTEDPGQFGLEGEEILGTWSKDGSIFHGFFPAIIRSDGDYVLVGKWRERTCEEVHHQIDLAEEYGHQLGIAVNTLNFRHVVDPDCKAPNAVVYSDPLRLLMLAGDSKIRIESFGKSFWTYPFIDFRSDDICDWFDGVSSRKFGFEGSGSDLPVGLIKKGAIVPAYPSYIFGKQIKLFTPGTKDSRLFIPSAEAARIHFDVASNEERDNSLCDGTESQALELDSGYLPLDESLEWCQTPEEDEALFQQSVVEFEKVSKPSKRIIRHQPSANEPLDQPGPEDEQDIDLYALVPHKLAVSLSLIKEHLPYDSLCVLGAFLTGLASMLRLGTSVTGNELTDYKVPINLYTILVAQSGRKKSPLQKLFVDQPASDVMLKVAKENDRIMKAWREENGGRKANEKMPQPVPIDIRINDYTGEAFVQALGKLDEVGRSVLVVRDEISALFESLNAYKSGKGSDEQQLLELYDGNGFRSLRVGDKGRAFGRAGVNIYGGIQPEILYGRIGKGDANGLSARFSYLFMRDMTKPLPTKPDQQKLDALNTAQKFLRDITSAVYELPAAQYKLDAGAMELFSEYEFKKQNDAQSTRISAQSALHGKSAGKVLRYAGILHIVEIVVNKLPSIELIAGSTLLKAIDIVDRQDRSTLACHAKLAGVTTEGLTTFQRRLHNIALKSKSPMSWSDIRQKMSSTEKQGKGLKEAEEAMSKLVALGLGEVTKGPNGGLYYKALKPLPA